MQVAQTRRNATHAAQPSPWLAERPLASPKMHSPLTARHDLAYLSTLIKVIHSRKGANPLTRAHHTPTGGTETKLTILLLAWKLQLPCLC